MNLRLHHPSTTTSLSLLSQAFRPTRRISSHRSYFYTDSRARHLSSSSPPSSSSIIASRMSIAPAAIPNFTLNDGTTTPIIGFGTGTAWFNQPAKEPTLLALQTGMYHIDAAQLYANEETVGEALSSFFQNSGNIDRSKIYVTTKLGRVPANATNTTIKETLVDSLKKLQLDYVDLFLIHAPILLGSLSIKEAWKQMEQVKKEGLARSIGVSNFRAKDLEEILEGCEIVPSLNQIEYHPYTVKSAEPIVALQNKHNIVLAAYGGLTSVVRKKGGPVDAVVAKIRERLVAETGNKDITEAQVLLKWLEGRKIVAITTTSKKERIQEYLAAPGLPALKPEELEAIDKAGAGEHYRHYTRMSHMDEL